MEKGREALRSVPLDAQRGMGKRASGNDSEDKAKQNYPWDRAYVWEVWDGERKQVTRLVEGYDLVLECVDDPLQLKGFYPLPEPMMANLTNDKCVPVSDWKLARGLYEEVDTLTARIAGLTRACRVAGCYDKTYEALGRVFDEAEENRLVPIDNFDMFGKDGGIKGRIDLIPIDQIQKALGELVQQRLNTLDLLRQVTGISDLMRGQQAENGTPGEARIKFQAASTRMRAWQKRFARFASELQGIKAEIIAKKFSDETILRRANVAYMEDTSGGDPAQAAQRQQVLQQAVALIRDKFHEYRVEVRPESIAAEDFATMKAERTEFVGAVADLLQKAQGAAAASPAVLPGLLQIVKWAAEGLRGSKEIGGVFDEMIDAAARASQQAQAQPQQPNPEQLKAQAQQQAAEAKMQEIQLKARLDAQHQATELKNDLLQDRAEAEQHAREQQTEHQQGMLEDKVRAQLDIEKEKAKLALKAAHPAPVPGPLPR